MLDFVHIHQVLSRILAEKGGLNEPLELPPPGSGTVCISYGVFPLDTVMLTNRRIVVA